MKEVLSGTCESGRVKFVKTNIKTDLLRILKKKFRNRTQQKLKKDLVDWNKIPIFVKQIRKIWDL